ncbi:MAG: sigma-54 dependent transcriptional regulator [Pseudomonadota bacterium]
MSSDILIVDDERDIRDLIAGILNDEGYTTRVARNADEVFAQITQRQPSLVLLDIWLQGSRLDGLEILDHLRKHHADVPVVMISGHGNVETAVSAIKRGAYDYIEKPFKADRLLLILARALESSQLKREVKTLRSQSIFATRIVGSSTVMNQLRGTIDKVAPANSRIVLSGAPGTGKELVARTIHNRSARANAPFVAINAAAITPETMELGLFGEEEKPGLVRRVGALEEAHGGTLYIDEVADMPRETQNKILRVLIDQDFTRVGGSTRVNVDVRIICSTSRDIENEIEHGRFREDLFHRLAVVPIHVPSLSEHREDIPELVHYFVEQIASTTGLQPKRIGDDTMAMLQTHDWPGNVRQLRNNIERVMILTQNDPNAVVSVDMLPPEIGAMLPAMPKNAGSEHIMALPLRDARETFEKEYLHAQISRFGGNISRTAEFVGMERSALHRKLKSLGLN